ncbi:MAG: hypothetical protein O2840_01475 [bacterium]|nr:hypothetical protein [bacterium]
MKKFSGAFKKQLEEVTKKSTTMVTNGVTMDMMGQKGEKVEEKFILYEDYIEELFKKKRAVAIQLVTPMPKMRIDIGNSVLHSIYEEIRDSLTLGMFPSAIMHSILLLEYAMRIKFYEKRQKSDPNAHWKDFAKLTIRQLTTPLRKAGVITKAEKNELDDFNDKIRNPYMHINIYELTKDVTLDVTSANIVKEEIKMMKDLPVTDKPFLWFAGKKKYDAMNVLPIMEKCVGYVNKIFD